MKRFTVVLLSLLHLVLLVASQGVTPSNVTVPARIDTHCHYIPPFYREILVSRNLTSGGYAIPTWNVSAHLALNARIGVVTSIAAISTPGARLPNDTVEEGRALARKLNEYGYNLTVDYPKRFLFWATLTLPDVEGSVAEAIYALDVLKAAGIILEANNLGELVGTRRYDPLYEVLNNRSAVVFIHPSDTPCPESVADSKSPLAFPPFVVDFLLDTTRAAVNLVYQNVTRDYPNIKWILAHSGGFLPFAASRAANGLAVLAGRADAGPAATAGFKTFYVDVAISATATALPSTTAFFNSTHITFGSDFPYSPAVGVLGNTADLAGARLRQSVRSRINYRNAYGLFKKFLI